MIKKLLRDSTYEKRAKDQIGDDEKYEELYKIVEGHFDNILPKRSGKYCLCFIEVIIFVYLLEKLGISLSSQAYGLSVDALGALILGRGLIKGPNRIMVESSTYWTMSRPLAEDRVESSIDGMWGIGFLIFGIFLQLLTMVKI